jgi:hypothetical protein
MFLAEKILEDTTLINKIKSARTEAPMTAADMKKWLTQQR